MLDEIELTEEIANTVWDTILYEGGIVVTIPRQPEPASAG